MNNKKNYIIKKVYFTLYLIYFQIKFQIVFSHEYHNGNLSYLDKQDYLAWKSAFRKMMWTHYKANYGLKKSILIEQFAKANIKVIRKTDIQDPDSPVVVLCVKNDKKRLQMLVEHYRKLGVKKFAFLDNGSTDGTVEWMQAQKDIDLFQTSDAYSSFVKESWINRIVSYYGFDYWYILTDSDELVTYVGMEQHPLSDVVQYAKKANVERIKGLTLDMYANTALFSESSGDSIEKEYCWMDSDSYEVEKRMIGGVCVDALVGGPRYRVMDVRPTLMKYPMIFFRRGVISADAHFQFPYEEMKDAPCYFAIRHYKFLNDDKQEYVRRSNPEAGFSAGTVKGGYYKKYLQAVEDGTTFMYEGSVQFKDSSSIKGIPFIEEITFDN